MQDLNKIQIASVAGGWGDISNEGDYLCNCVPSFFEGVITQDKPECKIYCCDQHHSAGYNCQPRNVTWAPMKPEDCPYDLKTLRQESRGRRPLDFVKKVQTA